MSGEAFLVYVQDVLVPTLCPGDIVVMDNLPAHKVVGNRAAIEAVGAHRRLLPPYSPDLNPIENAFASSRQSCARLPHAQFPHFGTLSATLSELSALDECANYFTATGYEPE